MKLRRIRFLLLGICCLILIVSSLLLWEDRQIPPKYEKNISQNFDSPDEEAVLEIADSINYSSILSKERFFGSTEPEAYLDPGTYLSYTSANFIDSEVIDYYNTRYDKMQEKGTPRQITLTYEANVTKRSEFRVFNSPAPQGVSWHNTTLVFSASDGSLIRDDSAHFQFFYQNQSSYKMFEWEYDFSFSDCHVIQMKLQYSEIYASTAAFFVNVEQILVLDRDFVPVLVGVDSGMAVS